MQCLICRKENPEGIKFCGECGVRLEKICPRCQAANPSHFKFCGECGQAMSAHPESPAPKSPSEKRTPPSPPPKELTEKILAQRGRIEGERRQVTVMFCDLEGSTALTEKLGDEKAFALIDEIFGLLTQQVHKYEGTVQEFRGDGIMALFGAPVALENAAQRAVSAAQAIHKEVTRFNNRVREEAKVPAIRLRIGIHTGPVVLGTIGSDLRLEFQVIGDTVNLAARVESLAEPGTTYVTEETFQQTEGFFRFQKMGEKQVKGKETPVTVYRVIAPSSLRTRFDVSAEQGLTPLVGRQRELELLLDGLERAKSGKGQAFSIISEAGLGKSRLLYEFRKAVGNEEVTFLEGRCQSFGRGTPYHPFIDILKANFEIKEGDKDPEIRRKVQQGLELIGLDQGSTLPYFLVFLSVKDSGIDPLSISPDGIRERMQETLQRILLKGAALRPLVIAIEDLHWIDHSSEETLKYLLDSIPSSRILSIFTYRPEFSPPWSAKSFHHQIMLQRLSNRETLKMSSCLLGTPELKNSLKELLLKKAEGIPFFLEEFIKSLKGLNLIENQNSVYGLSQTALEMPIPTTIQEVILARVDPLPAGAKQVLQTGSVIEREFEYPLIKQATGFPESDLLSYLSLLKDAELLIERGIHPQSSYIFTHALTREVVYDSILTQRRKKLHEEIAAALEKLHQEDLSKRYGVLADHYFLSENYSKAAHYSRLASKKFEKSVLLNEAIVYNDKAISSLNKLPKTDDVVKQSIEARVSIGLYMFQLFYFAEAHRAVDPIIALTFARVDKKRTAQLHTILGTHRQWVEEDFPKAFEHLETALQLSLEIGDLVSQFFASQWLGYARSFCCEFEHAADHFQKALEINKARNNIWGTSVVKSSLSQQVYNPQGMIGKGYQNSREALRIAEESGDIYSRAVAHTMYGFSCYLKGNWAEAEQHLLLGIDLNERIHFFLCNAFASLYLGNTYAEIAEHQKAENYYNETIRIISKTHCLPSMVNLAEISLIRNRLNINKQNIDLEFCYDLVNGNKLKIYDGRVRRFLGEILLSLPDQPPSLSRGWIEQALDADSKNGTRWDLAIDYWRYGEWFMKTGQHPKARENLAKALDIYNTCGADGWAAKTGKQLAIIS